MIGTSNAARGANRVFLLSLIGLVSCARDGAARHVPLVEPLRRDRDAIHIAGCSWVDNRNDSGSREPGKAPLACQATCVYASWKTIGWAAFDESDRKVESGGSGGWERMNPGESRRLVIPLTEATVSRVTRIEVEID